MHAGEKNGRVHREMKDLFGVDFHDFIERQGEANLYELASEFGLSIREVHTLKKHLRRL